MQILNRGMPAGAVHHGDTGEGLRNKTREVELDEKFTVRQLSADPETLSEIRLLGRYGKLLTETTFAWIDLIV